MLSSLVNKIKSLGGASEWYPVPGFYFKVMVVGIIPSTDDCSFMEVSGITVSRDTEPIQEGGVNEHMWNLPKTTKYSNLVLKRGMMPAASFLSLWVQMVMSKNMSSEISPKNIVVSLNNENGTPLYAWAFANAYPVKWEMGAMDSTKNEYLVETIEFTYQYYKQIPVAALYERLKSSAAFAAKVGSLLG